MKPELRLFQKGWFSYGNIMPSPTRYIQGKGELQNLRQQWKCSAKSCLSSPLPSGQARVAPAINASVAGSDCTAVYEPFHGECSQSEIDRVVADFQASGCDLIVGVGGGKTHDTAKAAAHYAGCPVVDRADNRLHRRALQRPLRDLHGRRRF